MDMNACMLAEGCGLLGLGLLLHVDGAYDPQQQETLFERLVLNVPLSYGLLENDLAGKQLNPTPESRETLNPKALNHEIPRSQPRKF